jgi:hypothetical protein
LGGPIAAESSIGRVVVDTLNYGQSLEQRYGGYATFAIAGIKTLATGGIAPLLSYGVDQGLSAAIPLLPENVLQPLATGLGTANDFVGGAGGGFLLQTDMASVVPIDREGVAWGATTLLGIGLTALAAKAVSAYRASKGAERAMPLRGLGADVNRSFEFGAKEIKTKFKHAADFGVEGGYNGTNALKFEAALQRHVLAETTDVIPGTYRGRSVTHFVDPQTGLNVMRGSNGEFISGWRLTPDQLRNVLQRGKM